MQIRDGDTMDSPWTALIIQLLTQGDVPTGFCEIDVKVNDNGEELECLMVSGHVASLVEGEKRDTIRPVPAWFMFVKAECEDPMTQLASEDSLEIGALEIGTPPMQQARRKRQKCLIT